MSTAENALRASGNSPQVLPTKLPYKKHCTIPSRSHLPELKNTIYRHKPHGGGYGLLTPSRNIERKARIYLASGECYCLQLIACTVSATSLSTISIYRHTLFSREKNSSPPSESEGEYRWTLHLRRNLASNPNTLLQKRACRNTQTGSHALLHKIPRHSSSCW